MNNQNAAEKSHFITVEGIEGAGKTTAIKFLQQLFNSLSRPYTLTREPGGTEIAEKIRSILLEHYEEPMVADTELLLMFASRAQHIAQVIIPALASGQSVICDRFTDASYAYQGGGRGVSFERIMQLENWVQGNLRPDIILLLDLPVEVGLARIQKRSTTDRIEREKSQFFQRVRQAYLARAEQDKKRYRIIDANLPVAEVQAQIRQVLSEILNLE